MYYKGVEGIMLCYDITSRKSFFELEVWTPEIKEKARENVTMYLVGTKCDLEDQRQVPLEEAQAFAQSHDLKYFETSALLSVNINNVFESMARDIVIKRFSKGIMLTDVQKVSRSETQNKCC